MKRGAGSLVVAASILGSGASSVLVGQPPPLTESIEVRVVNVDVVVTDADGAPVTDLGREDFELLIDGEPVEIGYFASLRDGVALEHVSEAGESSQADARPYLAVLVDGRSADRAAAARVVGTLRERAEQLTAVSRGVMVARQGRKLALAPGFSSDPEGILRAVAELERSGTGALGSTGRESLLRRLELAQAAAFTTDPDDPTRALAIEPQAKAFMAEIRAVAQTEHFETRAAIGDLERLVRLLAGLPGRKSVLYLGPGYNTRPGETLLRLWWAKYEAVARELGIGSIESETVKYQLEEEMTRLVARAAASGVSFYTFDPAGLESVGFGATLHSMQSIDRVGSEFDWSRQGLLALAGETGGVGMVDTTDLGAMVDRMVNDFGTYYSLGFEPTADTPDGGRIEVRLLAPGLRARHVERLVMRGPERRLEEHTLAALLTEEGRNPLEVGVEIEPGKRQRDGTWVMPVLLKVPLARVTLLPRETSHVGRLQVVFITQDEDGGLSDPAHSEVPIEIANSELLGAMSRLAGFRLRLQMREGEQRLAIGVRDEVAGEDSTLQLVVDAGGSSR